MPLPLKRALLGVLLAPGAPLGWIVVQHLLDNDVGAHIAANPWLYTYMFFGSMLVFAGFAACVSLQERKAVLLGLHDPLTGLYILRYFREQLKLACRLLERRRGNGCAVAIIDVDHFKGINDRYGHAAGDQVLRNVGEKIARLARLGDIVARVGGEEFAVIFQDAALDDAIASAKRIRSGIESTRFHIDDQQVINKPQAKAALSPRCNAVETSAPDQAFFAPPDPVRAIPGSA